LIKVLVETVAQYDSSAVVLMRLGKQQCSVQCNYFLRNFFKLQTFEAQHSIRVKEINL